MKTPRPRLRPFARCSHRETLTAGDLRVCAYCGSVLGVLTHGDGRAGDTDALRLALRLQLPVVLRGDLPKPPAL